MFKVMKKKGKMIRAYQLGRDHTVLDSLIAQGRIRELEGGRYEIFYQEAIKGGSGHGQLAESGDWIKIDGKGYPYPNKRDYFEENHKYVEGDTYEQIPKVLSAWNADCEMCEEIAFLLASCRLKINEDSYEEYYQAELWDTYEGASRDAVIIFHRIVYDRNGKVTDAEFNFVEKEEFQRTYNMVVRR